MCGLLHHPPSTHSGILPLTAQVYDGLLLDGKLSEYEAAFNAVDSSGNGTIGACAAACHDSLSREHRCSSTCNEQL